jgi:hypothetical protein
VDLQQNIEKQRQALRSLQQQLREDLKQLDNDQAKAMYETTAEALGGLEGAFTDFLAGDEAAWDRS